MRVAIISRRKEGGKVIRSLSCGHERVEKPGTGSYATRANCLECGYAKERGSCRAVGSVIAAILRCVPYSGTESITPWEVAGMLDLDHGSVGAALQRAERKGLVVRLRVGDYQLAPAVHS